MRILPVAYKSQFCTKNINFCSKPENSNQILNKILNSGFEMQGRVNLVSPDGESFEGYSFVKNGGKYWGITTLITDDKFYELGSLSTGSIENGEAWLSGKNLTTQNSPMSRDFMSPIFYDSSRSPRDGYYKRVMVEAFDTFIDYVKNHNTGIRVLKVDAKNQHSWDFGKRYGFIPVNENYDPFLFINELSYKL